MAKLNQMRFLGFLKRYPGFSDGGAAARQPLPLPEAAAYSFGVLAAFFVGMVLESRLRFTGYGEAFGAIPVLIFAAFVLRLPPPAPKRMKWGWRAVLLVLPFALLPFADLRFPELSASQAAVWMVVLVQVLGIGVSEELTFRFGLHRLWSSYSGLFYVIASATIFGLLHYPLGLQVSIISGVIGVTFAASRVAGMPLIPLIALHAFLDTPEVFRTMSMG